MGRSFACLGTCVWESLYTCGISALGVWNRLRVDSFLQDSPVDVCSELESCFSAAFSHCERCLRTGDFPARKIPLVSSVPATRHTKTSPKQYREMVLQNFKRACMIVFPFSTCMQLMSRNRLSQSNVYPRALGVGHAPLHSIVHIAL
jgi:hypothetical protein